MTLLHAGLYSVLAVFVYMVSFYLLAQWKEDYSVVDVGWGLGFVLLAALNFALKGFTPQGLLLLLLVGVWGARLGAHIFFRNKGKPEDFRYREMRENWGERASLISFFRIFMLQGLLMLAVGYPLLMGNFIDSGSLGYLDYAGIFLWAVGFFFEAVGDYQLKRFIREEKGEENRIMKKGLWKYTRHPNYFGEALLWWGVFLVVFSFPYGFLAFFGPLTINFLVFKVSGVPLLEERYADDEEFQRYAARTNKIFPWFPREAEDGDN